eukprot:31349-Pelagococcus_subviridis.AAC.23
MNLFLCGTILSLVNIGDASAGIDALKRALACAWTRKARPNYTVPRTTPVTRCTPFLQDFSRARFSPSTPRFRSRHAATPRDSNRRRSTPPLRRFRVERP